jgi:hypothetical protein
LKPRPSIGPPPSGPEISVASGSSASASSAYSRSWNFAKSNLNVGDRYAMSVLFSGRCACGAIRYECSAEPLLSEICYCRDCQRSSGNASAALMFLPMANFTLTSGSPKYYRVTGTSGFPLERGFCSDCGSPMLVKPHRFPNMIIIAAASLDDTSLFRPQVQMWTRSSPPWACLHSTLMNITDEPTAEERDALMALAPRLASFSRS